MVAKQKDEMIGRGSCADGLVSRDSFLTTVQPTYSELLWLAHSPHVRTVGRWYLVTKCAAIAIVVADRTLAPVLAPEMKLNDVHDGWSCL